MSYDDGKRLASKAEMSDTLEGMIDTRGMCVLLSTLSSICYGKAEHLWGNWQDGGSAQAWSDLADALDRIDTYSMWAGE